MKKLHLLFEIGNDRYALPTELVKEIVPLVRLKKIPRSPEYVAGLMNFRGQAVPVVDLCALLNDTPCEMKMSTRIILVDFQLTVEAIRPLGLIAQQVTETIQLDPARFSSGGVLLEEIHQTIGAAAEAEEMVQLFDLDRMLPKQEIGGLYHQ